MDFQEYSPKEAEKTPLLASRSRLQSDSSACWLLRKLSPVPKEATPLRWRIIFIAVSVLASTVVNVTMLFAFLPQMMRDFGYDEQHLGVYGGLVASSYFVGALVSSNFWGYFADLRGRRPVILVCLLGTAVFTLCFGFSFNIYWAICFRFLVGVFNGIIGTTKAILGDISDDSNQAVGCAFLSAGWGSGLLVGPAIGGYLAEPVKKYPFFATSELTLFEQFPYLLPNLLSTIICVASLVISLILLDETVNTRKAEKPTTTSQNCAVESRADAVVEVDEAHISETEADQDPNAIVPTAATNANPIDDDVYVDVKDDLGFCVTLRKLFTSPKVLVATSLFSIFSLACVGLDETVALWAATKTQFGGLGFDTNQLGTMTGAISIPCLFMNVYVFPKMEQQFGVIKTFIIGASILFATTICIPFMNELCDNRLHLWLTIVAVLVPNRMTYPICWSAADVFINNSAYAKYLGMVNGISMAFSFLFRSASPLGAGSLFSWSITTGFYTLGFPFGHHFVFFVISVTILICLFIGLFAPRKLDKQPETWDKIEKIPEMKPDEMLQRLKQFVIDANKTDTGTHAEQLLHATEEEGRKARLFNASFSNSLSYRIHPRRELRNFSGSITETADSSTKDSSNSRFHTFHSAKENISEEKSFLDPNHVPI